MEDELRSYIELSQEEIRKQLMEIAARQVPEPGHRQVAFNAVETLLCYGLFSILDPHRYGGGNINSIPARAKELATFFGRSPGSITNKMLNLDGARRHGKREEPLLFAYLASNPPVYPTLYFAILSTARHMALDEHILPDFLNGLAPNAEAEVLLGQDELPVSVFASDEDEQELKEIAAAFTLGDELTEKLVERKVRLAQHRFAQDVLLNCGRACVFCGFKPRSLPERSGLLRASHIKPWAKSNHRERVDVRNGLAACPMHDAAFDQGYLMVNGGYRIHLARVLQESIVQDENVGLYFGASLEAILLLPQNAKKPAADYLAYHKEKIFRG